MTMLPTDQPVVERAVDLALLLGKKSHFLFGPRQTGKTFLVRQSLAAAPYYDLLDTSVYLTLSRTSVYTRRRPLQTGVGEEVAYPCPFPVRGEASSPQQGVDGDSCSCERRNDPGDPTGSPRTHRAAALFDTCAADRPACGETHHQLDAVAAAEGATCDTRAGRRRVTVNAIGGIGRERLWATQRHRA
jgi:hypothetical protein